jgi:beta-lactamase regulating signal transducer with metallopeptidase domain
MEFWGNLVLLNAATATVLAGIVALVARKLTRSSLVHALWLLVLLKLVTVPALEVPLPTIATPPAPAPARTPELAGVVAVPNAGTPDPALDLRTALALVAGAGALVILTLAAWRIVRFRCLLRRSATTPDRIQERAARLAVTLGISRPPRIRVVPERIPPAVWPGLGRAEILLPAGLLERLTPHELDALLAHELAHVRRRDHWVRPFELVITALYWWLPVTWWARRNLRVAEEKSCDALVLRTLPERSRDYAEGLLKTVEFLSIRERPVPALAVGAAETSRLKERIVMILNRDIPHPPSGATRLSLAVIAVVALLVSPAWVESKAARGHDHEGHAHAAAAEREYVKKMVAVHREELRLEKELNELHGKRLALQNELEAMQVRMERQFMEAEAARLAQEGNSKEAAEYRKQVEEAQRELMRHLDRSEFEQLHSRKQAELSFKLRELQLAQEELRIDGQEELAEEIVAKSIAVEAALRQLHLEGLEAEVRRTAEELERDAARLAAEKKHAAEAEEE